jgi:hypothetical protein
MSNIAVNPSGVPQYPRGHAGRLLVVLAAIAKLDRPTAVSVANLTGLSKGNIDRLVMDELPDQFGVITTKNGPVYSIEDWGNILREEGVRKCLTVPLSRTTISTHSSKKEK